MAHIRCYVYFPVEILVEGCRSVGGFYGEITLSQNHLDYYIQEPSAILLICNISQVTSSCDAIIFAFANFALLLWLMIDKGVLQFLNNRSKRSQGISQNFKLQLEKRSSQIPVSALSQTEFTGPCLSKLLLKVLVAISKKME